MNTFSGKQLLLGILVLFSLFAAIHATPAISSVGIEVFYPEGNLSVNQNFFFHVTTNVSCIGSCGSINVSLDPYPPECTSYTPINWDANSIYAGPGSDCTSSLASGWYRLTGTYNKIPVQQSYSPSICHTLATGFIDFAYPTSPGETTSGNICYHWSDNTCEWQSTGVKITSCAGYYVFYLTSSVYCSLHPCTTDLIPDPAQDKMGLVNETDGAIPFYTNESNPRTISLSNGQSQLVTFWVNATGGVWNYTFFAFANETSNMAINDQTDNWTVSVYPPPSTAFVDLPSFIKTTDPTADVTINISADYFFGTPESATLDSVWWSYGSGNIAYTSPTTHAFAPGSYVLTAYANDTEGNIYSTNATLDIGNVACGDLISSSTVMTANLDCSGYAGDAVRLSADNIVFDCDGVTITGPGNSYAGISIIERNNVTVKNCDIRRFNYAIYMSHAYGSKIHDNTLTDSYYGLYMDYSDNNDVLDNHFTNNSYGFYLYQSDTNQIGRNTVIDTQNANLGSGSCPFLYLWNGSGYDYYTDLAGESIGASWFETPLYQAGIYELGDFTSKDGVYKMKIREVIPESDFVDELKLAIVDVPEGYGVLNQWHNTYSDNKAPPTGFMTIKDPIAPLSATDRYGNDVLSDVSDKDGVPLAMHEQEPNSVIVDFGHIDNPQYAKLVITGWSSYEDNPDMSSLKDLKIETMDASGKWKTAKQFGKFTGDSRTFVFDIADILKTDDTRMRITAPYSKTTINVIDQILLDDSAPVDFSVTYVDPSVADLHWGGSTPYVYATSEHRHMVTDESDPNIENYLMYGNFTKYGDARPLLNSADDEFAIMRHGDELSLEFNDIAKQEGKDRFVFLKSDVMYSIRYSIKGFVSDSINPMPFHGMSEYPYGTDESYPNDADHQAYRAEWNTRSYEPGERIGGSLPYSFNNTIFDNTITGSQYSTGLYLDHEDSTSLIDNTISGVEIGIDIYESVNTTVRGNHISSANGRGVSIDYSSDNNRILDNTIRSNNSGGCYPGYCGGVSMYSDCNDNLIQGNTITAINTYSVYMDNSFNNNITANTLDSSAGGYYSIYLTTTPSGNRFLHNTLKGDYWVSDNHGDNIFNDSSTGNTYYFADGTGAWQVYNISDLDGNGYADSGSDLPFDNSLLGSIWPENGYDEHPGVAVVTESRTDHKKSNPLYEDARSECNGSQILVTSSSGPVSGAKVIVFQTPSLIDIASGTTDENGALTFNACGMSVRAYASKDGYKNVEGEFELVSCGSCQAPPECTDDGGCAADMACSGQKCVAVQCACGTVSSHQCAKYACCNDAECGAGKKCSDHSCVSSQPTKPPEQPKPECTVDSDCGSGKVCTGNKCVLKPECQKDSDCQSGYGCTANKCVKMTNGTQNTTTNKTSTSGGTPAAPSSTGNTGAASASGPEPVLMVGLLILLVAILLVVVYFIRPRKK